MARHIPDISTRVQPLEPRYVVTETMNSADNQPFSASRLVHCIDCDGGFAGRWNPDGSPTYDGGWRKCRWEQRRGHGPDLAAVAVWGYALCPCDLGRVLKRSNPRVPFVRTDYPPHAAMSWAWVHDHPASEWRDPRRIRAILPAELRGWRSQFGIPDLEQDMLEPRTDWPAAQLTAF